MNTQIWHHGIMLATMSSGQYLEIIISDERLLHVGPDGLYFKQAAVPADGFKVRVVE